MGAERGIPPKQEEVGGDQFDLNAEEMDAMESAVEEVARRRAESENDRRVST